MAALQTQSEIYVEHVSNVHDSVLANSRKQNEFSCIVNGIGASEKIETTRLTDENLKLSAFKWYQFHLSTIYSSWDIGS